MGLTLTQISYLRAQNSTFDYILLSGEIVSPAGTPIDGVHILNTNTNYLGISDASGFFSISMLSNHVLRISAVGFKTYYYTLKKHNRENITYVKIILQTVTVGLKNIDIIAREVPRAEHLFRPRPIPAPFSFGYTKGYNMTLNPV